MKRDESLTAVLDHVREQRLIDIDAARVARVRRRIVEGEALAARLDVAAFSSAP